MSVGIVYDNVPGSGGTLFEGKKFWVAQRVPARSTIVQNITSNGGAIVALEKKADFKIADHARNDAPAGSYSWKLIEDAVDKGRLEDVDEFLIGHAQSRDQRPVGSTRQPGKGTKTPFTPEEDLLLAKYVTKYELGGRATSGNAVYKRFEKKYPRHTFQSWRDRWVKRLVYQPRPDIEETELSADDEVAPNPSTPGQDSTPRKGRVQNAASPANGRARKSYTHEEDELLISYIKSCARAGKPLSGNKIYQEFAADFPQHTWHSWRDRWLKTLQSTTNLWNDVDSDDENQNRVQAAPPRSNQAEAAKQSPSKSSTAKNLARAKVAHIQAIREEASQENEDLVRVSIARHDEIDTDPRIQNAAHQQEEAAVEEPPALEEQATQPQRAQPIDAVLGDPTPKEQFYRDLRDFTQAKEIPLHIWPTLRGLTFDVWELWQAARAQEAAPSDRDWEIIAETLGYDWMKDEEAPSALRTFYEAHLAEFEAVMMEWEAEGDESEDPDAESQPDIELGNTREGEVVEDVLPPQPSSLKRPRENEPITNDQYPESSRKRTKHDRNSEIPSTPDQDNGTAHLRTRSVADSPSVSKGTGRPQDAESSRQAADMGDSEAEDQVPELPILPPNTKRMVEPETQDFRFDMETQADAFVDALEVLAEDDFDDGMTPSQQLQIESETRSRGQPFSSPAALRRSAATTPRKEADGVPQSGNTGPKTPGATMQSVVATEQTTSTTKRKRGPFLPDDENEDLLAADGSPLAQAKRRSLTRSWQKSSPEPPQIVEEQQDGDKREPPPSNLPHLDEVIDHWVALGYSRTIAVRALEAATWCEAEAGQLMQELKDGKPMPTNWQGIWTGRDDEALQFVDSRGPDGGNAKGFGSQEEAKAAKRWRKEWKRLMNKHGEDHIDLRRKWLNEGK